MSFEGMILNRPVLDTFDSGYEHSLEHLLDLKEMLAEETEESTRKAAIIESFAIGSSA